MKAFTLAVLSLGFLFFMGLPATLDAGETSVQDPLVKLLNSAEQDGSTSGIDNSGDSLLSFEEDLNAHMTVAAYTGAPPSIYLPLLLTPYP